MIGAALGALGRLGNNREHDVDTSGGLKGIMQQLAAKEATSVPSIPMSESYNSAASSPVFPPATQEKAAAVFGTNDQRQSSTTGFKQEVKDRIIEDITSL